MSGNHLAASGDTKVKIAAGTSPAISRSIAFVCPSLSWTSTAPAAAIAVRIDVPDPDCWYSIATSLPARSDTNLISGRAITRATRSSVLFVGTDAVGSVSLGGRASVRPDASALLASFRAAGVALAAVTCSASAVAAATRSCIVLLPGSTAAAMGGETAILVGGESDPVAALPAVSSRACDERGESGMRKILKPAISGNHSDVSGYAEVRTAAGTSPLINRSIALV